MLDVVIHSCGETLIVPYLSACSHVTGWTLPGVEMILPTSIPRTSISAFLNSMFITGVN